MRQRQLGVAADHLVAAGGDAHQIDVQRPRSPLLFPNAVIGRLDGLRRAQPGVGVELRVVGDHHRVEERALVDPAPGVGLVDP